MSLRASDINEEHVETAFTVTKVILCIFAILFVVMGILLIAMAQGDIGVLVSGIIMMIAGPLVVFLLWIILRVEMALYYDVKVIKKKVETESNKKIQALNDISGNIKAIKEKVEKDASLSKTVKELIEMLDK